MKLHDFIPGRAYRTLCLHGFAPKDSTQWEAAYRLLLRCHERLGIRPERVTLDDVPGLSDDARWIEAWEKWLKNHPFPMPSSLSVSANVFRGLILPWPHTRAYGDVANGLGLLDDGRPLTVDGGMFEFFCDAALYRSAFGVFDAIAADAWSCIPFEYGYAFTSDDPTGFCMGGLRSKFTSDLNALRKRWSEFRNHTPEGRVYSAWMDKQQGRPVREITPGPRYGERLRDIFPLNYLVDTHLALQVGNQTLGEWIQEDPSHGVLTRLAEGLWCWSVPEKTIPKIRASLAPCGFLVAPGGQ